MRTGLRSAVVLAVICGSTGCGGAPTPSDPSQGCDPTRGIGTGSSCTLSCRSWSHAVLVGLCNSLDDPNPAPCPGYTRLVIDRSSSPATAEMRVGELIEVNVIARNLNPPNCNSGYFNGATAWVSSDASVLQLRTPASSDHKRAVFRAVAAGTARLAAENLPTPGGPAGRVELIACGQSLSLSPPPCPTPGVPLTIRVVP